MRRPDRVPENVDEIYYAHGMKLPLVKRLAPRLYFAVPNRWFPVEHHTGIPLLHYWPALFRRALKGTALDHWSDPRELAFLSAPGVGALTPAGVAWRSAYCGFVIGPFSSNLAVWTE